MTSEIIIGGIGILSTVTSGWVSWFFSKKKYYSEVDHNLIANMEESLEFYKRISDDNKSRLDELILMNNTIKERNEALEEEIHQIRGQMLELAMSICMDLTCKKRISNKEVLDNNNGETKNRAVKADCPNRRRCQSAGKK